ncbi:MAG: EamA family transporter [Gammaproteobacteria bacterium]|nr:EamA family transporter [Gammaproteobacteria bacterium]
MPARRAGLLQTSLRSRIRLAFAVIYLVWGVTYAVNRIMALNLPPLLAAGSRFLFAGGVLLLVARARGLALPSTGRDWALLTLAALLGITISNGLAVLSLQHLASNQAALIGSSSAFWIAWLGMYGRRGTAVNVRTWCGLALGFLGVAVLLSAHGFGSQAQLSWQAAVLGSALCWALASMLIRASHSHTDPLALTACYLLIGGAVLSGLGLLHGDAARWTWSVPGVGAILFLAVFSSTFGFVSYTFLLRHETPSRIGTYAYVNPMVAVFTGWVLLGERLDRWQVLGSLIIFAAVFLVRSLRLRPRGSAVPDRRDS